MKNSNEKQIISSDLIQRTHQRCIKRSVKMFSLVLAGTMAVMYCMIVPIGHADDTCLQVPTEQTLSFANLQTSNSEYIEFVSYDASVEKKGYSIEDDTYIITEQTDRDGIAAELLDPSAFTETDETMYVLTQSLSVRTLPATDAEVCGVLAYADQVARVGIGSAWSKIEFITEEGEVVSGYVLSSKLSADVLATPTPTPTETPTPTPKPKKKSVTPTPEPENDSSSVASTPVPTSTPTPKPAVEETACDGTYYSVGEVNVRSGPDTSYSAQRKLSYNEAVTVVAKTSNGWYKLSDGGYVKSSLLSSTDFESAPVEQPSNEPTPVPSENNEPSESSAPKSSGSVNIPSPDSCDLLTYARAFIGIPYVYCGASLDGLDCSGFVMYVYAHYYGISLPHQSASIAQLGTDVTNEERVPGDVICHDYNNDGRVDHVSLYCGSGVVIHASTSKGGIIEDYIPMQNVVTVRRFI